MVELLKAPETYPLGYRAAFRHAAEARVRELRTRALFCANPLDPLAPTTRELAGLAGAEWAELPSDADGAAATVDGFLVS